MCVFAQSIKTIAVIGPNADAPRYGDYTGAEHHRGGNINMLNAVPLLEGIKTAYSRCETFYPFPHSVSLP